MSSPVAREKAVFCQAVEIADPEQRRQFLDQACGADKVLRQQVEKLLALSPSAGNFFKDWIIARILARECQELFVQAGHQFPASDALQGSGSIF